jgi:hypothetical protein
LKIKIKDNTIKQFIYSYSYESNQKGKNYTCDMIIRKLDELRVVNNCIFDTPDYFTCGDYYFNDKNQFRL